MKTDRKIEWHIELSKANQISSENYSNIPWFVTYKCHFKFAFTAIILPLRIAISDEVIRYHTLIYTHWSVRGGGIQTFQYTRSCMPHLHAYCSRCWWVYYFPNICSWSNVFLNCKHWSFFKNIKKYVKLNKTLAK